MQELPFSVQSFGDIREVNYLYVDKTKYVYELIKQRQSFFLSRPRRFGKSIFISTLKEALLGKKELFKDLWIEKTDYTWPVFGVIHLDFSRIDNTSAQTVRESLFCSLKNIAEQYNLDFSLSSSSPIDALNFLAHALNKKFGKVAVLVDEYDCSILSNLYSPELESILKTLHNFFSTLKGLEEIKFLFVTGVTAFAKAGLFSGMSHPEDLSRLPGYACLCGYTEEEITKYFTPYLEQMALEKKIPLSELREQMKKQYNGYHFTKDSPSVYNPFSITKAIREKELNNFWFDSGSPAFLMEILKRKYAEKDTEIFHMEEFRVSEMEPKYFDPNSIPTPALMLQTGYLTIKGFEGGIYTLGFPNLEVQSALQRHILNILLGIDEQNRLLGLNFKRITGKKAHFAITAESCRFSKDAII